METIETKKKRGVSAREKTAGGTLSSVLAFACLSSGVFSPVLGVIFIIIHSVLETEGVFARIGTVLMIVSIPFLLAGSHFLDVWDKYRKKSEIKDPRQ